MKILLFTDNHFCTNSSIVRSIGDKYSTRIENQIQSLNWVNEIAMQKGCDMMIHLGDFFDSSTLNAQEISALKEIKWNTLPKKFLVGNHELGTADLTFNSMNALATIGEVITQPSMFSSFGVEIFMLPYILESERKPLKDYLQDISKDYYYQTMTTQEVKNVIVLSHNDIAGLQLGKYISKNGFDIKEIYDNCDLFINGHLHNQTQINDKTLNLGNLTGQNFSEDGFKYSHCVAIVDTMTLKVELINNPHAFKFYHIETETLQQLESQINMLDKQTAIGTIKVYDTFLQGAKELCKEHFKEFRILVTYTTTKTNGDTPKLNQENHITKFKNFIAEHIGDNDIVNEELSLL